MGQLDQKVVLVVGAGAGVEYGFPTGQGLLDMMADEKRTLPLDRYSSAGVIVESKLAHHYPTDPIVQMMLDDQERRRILDEHLSRQMDFRRALRESGQQSVDSFLGRSVRNSQQHSQVGLAATAYYLMRQEHNAVYRRLLTRGWYQRLFQSAIDWQGNPHPGLRVITFNYDVSLDFALYLMIYNSYCHNNELSLQRLNQLAIHHVYGSTDLDALCNRYVHASFDSEVDIAKRWDLQLGPRTLNAARNIRIIGEARAGEAAEPAWKQWLIEADEVVFLGFGFDETNLKNLGAHLDNRPWREALDNGLKVKATAYKMGESGIKNASALLGLRDGQGDFLNCDCETLLRERTLVGTWNPGKKWA